MKILVIDNRTQNLEKLTDLLSNHEVSVCQRDGLKTLNPDAFDTVILSGGSGTHSVKNHPEYYKMEIDFVQNSKTKVIGICLGCQIVASAFGCTLKELYQKEQGTSIVQMSNGRTILVYESHRFTIDHVSKDIEVLGTSEHGIEVIQHKIRPIFGLQFHPEMFVNKTEGDELFLSILEKFRKIN